MVFSHPDQQQQKPLQQQEEKVAKIHSSSKTEKKQTKSSFSMGFRSCVRHFRDAILGLLPPSLPRCFPIRGPAAAAKAFCSSRRKRQPKFIAAARGKSSQNHHFLWVSEVTLGASPSFTAMVFSHPDQQQQKPLQQQEEKVAKIHSSSKMKKQPKSSFSMGFRSYVRGFSVLHCHGVFPSGPAAAKAFAAAGGKGSQNS